MKRTETNTDVLCRIEDSPVIAAIREEGELAEAVSSSVGAVFLLHADIFNITRQINYIKESGKSALIHIDFLEGIGSDHRAIDYIYEAIKPDGIISTRSTSVKYAKGIGLFAVQRFFIVDSLSIENLFKTVHTTQPDMIEVMPGIMPGVIRKITGQLKLPLIAGGLIADKSNIYEALSAGAVGVSTSNRELWKSV